MSLLSLTSYFTVIYVAVALFSYFISFNNVVATVCRNDKTLNAVIFDFPIYDGLDAPLYPFDTLRFLSIHMLARVHCFNSFILFAYKIHSWCTCLLAYKTRSRDTCSQRTNYKYEILAMLILSSPSSTLLFLDRAKPATKEQGSKVGEG